MFRAIPVSNKLIEKKSHERSFEKHQRKLQEIKPLLPERPETFSHLKRNKKKELLVEERFTEIERCNRLLLERLTNIMKKPSKMTPNSQQQPQYRVRSLNRDVRKRELVKITIENQEILKRIQNRKSQYSVQHWLEVHKKEQKYLKNISEYPIQLYQNTGSRMDASFADYEPDPLHNYSYHRPRTYETSKHHRAATPGSYLNNLSFDEGYMRPSTNQRSVRTRTHGQLLTHEESRAEHLAPFEPNNVVIAPKNILYQTRKRFGAVMYSVQFYIQNKMFKIVASDTEKAGIKIFSTSEKDGEKILDRFDYDYELIMDTIRFRGTQIVLDLGLNERGRQSSHRKQFESNSPDSEDKGSSPFESGQEDMTVKEMTEFVDGQLNMKQLQSEMNQKAPTKGTGLPLRELSNYKKDSGKKERDEEMNKLTFRGQGSDIDEDLSYE